MTYKAIVFDFFGVLVVDANIAWLMKKGLEKQIPEIIQKYYVGSDTGSLKPKDLYANLGKLVGLSGEAVEKEITSELSLNQPLFDYIRSTQVRKAVCSNAPLEFVETYLKENKVDSIFDVILTSSKVGVRKPDKEIFELLLEKLNIPAELVIFIDDNEENVRAASSLGIKALLFTSNSDLFRSLAGLDLA